MNHIRQFGKRNCGQIAVAVITGKPVAEIEQLLGHDHGTKTKELAILLRQLGYECGDKCAPWYCFRDVPELALAQLHSNTRGGWHWIVVHKGMVYDGHEFDAISFSTYRYKQAQLRGGRITSYLPVRRAACNGYCDDPANCTGGCYKC